MIAGETRKLDKEYCRGCLCGVRTTARVCVCGGGGAETHRMMGITQGKSPGAERTWVGVEHMTQCIGGHDKS